MKWKIDIFTQFKKMAFHTWIGEWRAVFEEKRERVDYQAENLKNFIGKKIECDRLLSPFNFEYKIFMTLNIYFNSDIVYCIIAIYETFFA